MTLAGLDGAVFGGTPLVPRTEVVRTADAEAEPYRVVAGWVHAALARATATWPEEGCAWIAHQPARPGPLP